MAIRRWASEHFAAPNGSFRDGFTLVGWVTPLTASARNGVHALPNGLVQSDALAAQLTSRMESDALTLLARFSAQS
jgi:hypothetical protein